MDIYKKIIILLIYILMAFNLSLGYQTQAWQNVAYITCCVFSQDAISGVDRLHIQGQYRAKAELLMLI